jgi:hypothetical protein
MNTRREYMKQYYQLNKEKINKRSTDWNKNNKEKCLTFIRNWNLKNTEKVLLTSAKARAIQKGLDFNIDETDIIIPNFCPILNIKITRELGKGKLPSNPSIDRIDSSKGYTKDNIWIISHLANRMKQDATEAELIAFAKGVLNCYDRKTDN